MEGNENNIKLIFDLTFSLFLYVDFAMNVFNSMRFLF